MHITQWAEYGVHCCVYLAECEARGVSPVGAAEIARSQNLGQNFSVEYAQQVLQRLRKGGIIESVRGPQGGYKLTREPAKITLFDILKATEGDTFEVICETKPLSDERCAADAACGLRHLWTDLRDHINSFLSERTLEQLVQQSNHPGKLTNIGDRRRNQPPQTAPFAVPSR